MSSEAGDAERAQGAPQRTILLHIVSPSTEIPPGLSFPSLPTTTTVGQLKAKITAAVPTKPGPERQRLIHRGRALVNESDTLLDVFGHSTLYSAVDHSLHLVVRPILEEPLLHLSAQQILTHSSSANNNDMPSHVQPRSQSQSSVRDARERADPNLNQALYDQNTHHARTMLPPGIQHEEHFNGQQVPPSSTVRNQTPIDSLQQGVQQSGTLPPNVQARHQPSLLARQSLQALMNEMQRQRAAAGMHGVGQMLPLIDPGRDVDHLRATGTSSPATVTGTLPSSSSSFTRQVQGSDGQMWHISVNENTITLPVAHTPGSAQDSLAAHGPSLTRLQPQNPHITAGSTAANSPNSIPSQLPEQLATEGVAGLASTLRRNQEQLRHEADEMHDVVRRMQDHLQRNNAPPLPGLGHLNARIDQINQRNQESWNHMTRSLRIPTPTSNTTLPTVAAMADQPLRPATAAGDSMFSGTPLPPTTSHLNRPTTAPPSGVPSLSRSDVDMISSSHGASSTVAYLLSSPQGPYALVFTPTGNFSTNRPPAALTFGHRHPQTLGQRPLQGVYNNGQPVYPAQIMQLAQEARAVQAAGAVQRPQVVPVGVVPNVGGGGAAAPLRIRRNRARNNGNHGRDLLRVLLPLGGHLWLIVRLLGFVFFFTGGSGWRRIVMLLASALAIYIAQTGMFADAQEAIWGPVRRHLEGLLPNIDEPDAPVPPGATDGRAGRGGAGDGHENTTLNPEDTAARLIRQRQQRDIGWVRERVRRLERALVIFLASLVPGFGERHIAAREAANAAVESQMRRARQRLEEENRRQAQEADGSSQAQPEATQGVVQSRPEGDDSASANPEQPVQQQEQQLQGRQDDQRPLLA